MWSLLRRAGQLIWIRKSLIVLGMVVAVISGGVDGGITGMLLNMSKIWRWLNNTGVAILASPGEVPPAASGPNTWAVIGPALALVIALLCVGLIFAIAVAIVARIAAGSLIVGANAAAEGRGDLRIALREGVSRAWRLVVIISIPPIPITIGAILTAITLGIYLYAAGTAGDPARMLDLLRESSLLWIVLAGVNAPFVLTSLGLLVIQIPADRACMLEGAMPLEAFRRGGQLIRHHPGITLGLLGAQIVVGTAVGWLLNLPGLFATILLGPVRVAVNGLLIALFSTAWTLAWHEWIDGAPSID